MIETGDLLEFSGILFLPKHIRVRVMLHYGYMTVTKLLHYGYIQGYPDKCYRNAGIKGKGCCVTSHSSAGSDRGKNKAVYFYAGKMLLWSGLFVP